MFHNLLSHQQIFHNKNLKTFTKQFAQEDNWHELDVKTGNLGYAWIHYSYIRILKPKNVLCVGSRYGLIPAICALACRDNGFGVVDFVDAGFDQNNPDHEGKHCGGVGFWKTDLGRNHFKKFGLENHIKLHIMITRDFFTSTNKKWGYAHLDGDHSYKGINFDFNKTWPNILKGGIVAFHDINTTDTMGNIEYGTRRIWQELKKKYNTTIELPGTCGLGLIQK